MECLPSPLTEAPNQLRRLPRVAARQRRERREGIAQAECLYAHRSSRLPLGELCRQNTNQRRDPALGVAIPWNVLHIGEAEEFHTVDSRRHSCNEGANATSWVDETLFDAEVAPIAALQRNAAGPEEGKTSGPSSAGFKHAAAFMTSEERYNNLVNSSPEILQRVSLTDIASFLGIGRETLSRIRKVK